MDIKTKLEKAVEKSWYSHDRGEGQIFVVAHFPINRADIGAVGTFFVEHDDDNLEEVTEQITDLLDDDVIVRFDIFNNIDDYDDESKVYEIIDERLYDLEHEWVLGEYLPEEASNEANADFTVIGE